MTLRLSILICCLFICKIAVSIENTDSNPDEGKFWQITDIHYDPTYAPGSSFKSCHGLDRNPEYIYGDYHCDSPITLVKSAIGTLKNRYKKPDFILWTGDSVPHVADSDPMMSTSTVFNIVGNVTDLLIDSFPDTPILPTMGNHDHFPRDQVPVENTTDYYNKLTKVSHWSRLLNKLDNLNDSRPLDQFHECGFYSTLINNSTTLISLNTILWYANNHITSSLDDPCGQFQWLQDQLDIVASEQRKAIVFGHIPPGYMARSHNIKWYTNHFNSKLHTILSSYTDVISSAIFGHEHTDAAKLIYQPNSNKQSGLVLMVAPSVTPWLSTLDGVGANNPSVRLYTYNRNTGRVLDYTQFYMDLRLSKATGTPKWTEEYVASQVYGDLSFSAYSDYFTSMLTNTSTFADYYRRNSVSQSSFTNEDCDQNCRMRHYCSAICIDHLAYDICVAIPAIVHTLTAAVIVMIVLFGVLLPSCCVFWCLFCICRRRRNGTDSERVRIITAA